MTFGVYSDAIFDADKHEVLQGKKCFSMSSQGDSLPTTEPKGLSGLPA